MTDVATGPGWELRLGRWQDVLRGEEWDALVTDPPYSPRVHAGQNEARAGLEYDALDAEAIGAWGRDLLPRTRSWAAVLTDHDSALAWERVAAAHGRTTYSPLACVHRGSRVRLAGDGPAQWSVSLCLSRPRSLRDWGSRPGAYVVPRCAPDDRAIRGGKTSWLMREIVRDYTRRGWLVCDPCAGAGTTLLAAVLEGRRALGAEVDPDTYARAVARLRLAEERLAMAQRQAELFAPASRAKQGRLL